MRLETWNVRTAVAGLLGPLAEERRQPIPTLAVECLRQCRQDLGAQ